jgi:hypothetical protein
MAFFVVGLPGMIVALAALALPEPRRGATEDVDEAHLARHAALPLSWPIYAGLLRSRSYIYNLLAMAMLTFALGGLQVWTPKFLHTGDGAMSLRAADLGLGVSVVASGLIGTPLGAWLADRLAKRYRGAYFTMSGVSMIMAVPFILTALLAGLHGQSPVVIFGSILIGLTLALLNYGAADSGGSVCGQHIRHSSAGRHPVSVPNRRRVQLGARLQRCQARPVLGPGHYPAGHDPQRRLLLPGKPAPGG